jgi:uncharacterized protein YndB with AHSA1/START domain
MAHYRTTIESSLPPEEAFAELADFSSSERWDPGVTSARRLDDGALGVGSTFEVISRFAGRDVPLVYEIVEFEPHRRLVLRAESRTVISLDTITFEPTAAGTSVTYDADLRLRGLLRVLDPLLGVAFTRIGDRARDGLRETLRAQPDRSS